MSERAESREPLDPDDVRELAQRGELARLRELLVGRRPQSVVELLEALPPQPGAVVFRLLDKGTSINAFDLLDERVQADLIVELGDAEVVALFAAQDPDEQAWLLEEVPAKVARRVIATSAPADLDAALTLLGYPAGSVGRRMSVRVLHGTPDESVAELLARVRANDADPDLLTRFPVLSDSRVLVGGVGLIDLVRADPDARVGDVMDADPAFAQVDDDVERVARRVLDRGWLSVPVVDREHRLLGLLPITDAARIDRDAVAEDHARAGGSEPLRRPYLLTPVRQVTRARITWLLVLAVSAALTVQVLEFFEATLAEQVVLALFIPLLTGVGGNTGSQAATTVTRALAVGEVELRDVGRVAFKEARTGAALGALLAVLAFCLASPLYGTGIGTVIGLTLLLNCPIAATVGGVIPLVARACRVDPAVFSTPFISTFCDATGLIVYFGVAIAVL